MSRKHIPLKVKLAAMILAWVKNLRTCDVSGDRDIPYEQSKNMTAEQIISRVQFDHYPVRHADGGVDEPWNLTPRLIADHRQKTKRDARDMAKERKVRRAVDEHVQRMLLKCDDEMEQMREANRALQRCVLPKRSAVIHRLVTLKDGSKALVPWPSRPFPPGGKIPSRPFPKRRKQR